MGQDPQANQAAAIPYRHRNGTVEICLVTTISKGKWSIPKGFIDPGESATETALKEAYEEAGLTGAIADGTIGTYTYRKWGSTFTVAVFLMEVERADDVWEESDVRERRWAPVDEALTLIDAHPVQPIFEQAIAQLGWNGSDGRG